MSDDQTGNVRRPNANYKLSKPDDAVNKDEGLVFYYNRERRLENAPESVKKIYQDEGKPVRFGLFHSLVADKPRKALFIVIILLCAAILTFTMIGYFDTSYNLDGNRIEIVSTKYDGITTIVLKKTARRADAHTGAVDVAVSPVVQSNEEQFPVFYHRIFFTLESEETYRFAVPFDSPELVLLLQNEQNSVQIVFKPE